MQTANCCKRRGCSSTSVLWSVLRSGTVSLEAQVHQRATGSHCHAAISFWQFADSTRPIVCSSLVTGRPLARFVLDARDTTPPANIYTYIHIYYRNYIINIISMNICVLLTKVAAESLPDACWKGVVSRASRTQRAVPERA